MNWDLNSLDHKQDNVSTRRDRYTPAIHPTSPIGGVFQDLFKPEFPFAREFTPSLGILETENEVRIECELPGMKEKDIELSLDDNVLAIKGKKRSEEETHIKDMYMVEHRYGSFSRLLLLPPGLDVDKVSAGFKDGVLSIKLPKTEESKKRAHNIHIRAYAA